MKLYLLAAVFVGFSCTSAKDIIITVGNTTNNAALVFQPPEVTAVVGDTVFFNFTNGNHTATQSTFDAPCVPAHVHNISLNGFDSSFRNAGNMDAITILAVPILPENYNQTMWFFDYNTCAQGGVGVINANDSSYENYAGFVRNAKRLNGTATTSSVPKPSTTSSTTQTSKSSSDATRTLLLGGAVILPLLIAALVL